MNAVPVIETRALTKRYGEVLAVDSLDLRIRRGEIFGLLGPNGAGKTTTILMLLGLSSPSGGSANVLGLDPTRFSLEIKRRVGYVPDDVGFYDELTGRENLRYTARLNRLYGSVAEKRLNDLLDQVGLTGTAPDRKVKAYSRGMRQRLGLADAMVKDPEILVLDEPTVNIDPEGVRELLAVVRSLRDERGTTVLLSSHLLHQVESICDRIGIFVAGRLVATGSLAKLAAAVEDRFTIEVGVAGVSAMSTAGAEVAARLGAVVADGDVIADGTHWLVVSDHDVRGAIVDDLAGAGLRIDHLARRGADLDAVYHRYFTANPAAVVLPVEAGHAQAS